MPTAALSDVEIHYEERGEGAPLLLVAGIPRIASDWPPLAERLAATRRVIAFDNRGSGGSTVTSGPYTTAQLADDAVALLDRLDIERSDVFGVSLGGMICQELVRDYGFSGSYLTVQRYVDRGRPMAPEPVSERFETAPGHQAQVDWSHEYRSAPPRAWS